MSNKKTKKRCERKIVSSDQLAIRELRLELNMTQREAGKCLGLSSKGVEAIENGRVGLGEKRIEEIVNAYGVTNLEFIRLKKVAEKKNFVSKGRQYSRKVLMNSDRRSYKKMITKECKVLKCLRRTKKISQNKASELCGYSRPTIGHIENGRIELTESRIKHIIECYGHYFYRWLVKNKNLEKLLSSCNLCCRGLTLLSLVS